MLAINAFSRRHSTNWPQTTISSIFTAITAIIIDIRLVSIAVKYNGYIIIIVVVITRTMFIVLSSMAKTFREFTRVT